ncbi:MAG: hypothetical protein RML72_09165 [Bacteroidia bacterium]|nr:hypothetical protein [Bacteroidia bacterium]
MNYSKIIFGLWVSTYLIHGWLKAQVYGGYWQNQVKKNIPLNWKAITTQQFVLVYPDNQRILAENTLRLAQKALHELNTELEYFPIKKIKIVLYKDFYHFIYATNNPTIENWSIHWNTSTGQNTVVQNNFSKNILRIFFNTSFGQYYQDIKTQLTYALLNEMLYQNEASSNLQNRTLLYPSNWFFHGLSLYLGQGWQTKDQVQLQYLSPEIFLEWIQNNQVSNPLLEKSIWYFIAKTYGKKKIGEILYMCRLTRSIENGFQSVLGFRISTLTQKWLEFASSQVQQLPNQEIFRFSHFRPGQTPISISPNGKYIAYTKKHHNNLELLLYEANKKTTTIISKIYFPTTYFTQYYNPMTYKFSPDNSIFTYTTYLNNKYYLIYYELKTKNQTLIDITDQFSQVISISYDISQKNIIISAIKNGQVDIFLSQIKFNNFINLTSDIYDDLDPCFSPDGKSIFFSSNRDTSLNIVANKLSSKSHQINFINQKFNIYKLTLNTTKNSIKAVTKETAFNKTSPFFINHELYSMTDYENKQYLAHLKNDSTFVFIQLPFPFSTLHVSPESLFLEVPKNNQSLLFTTSLEKLHSEPRIIDEKKIPLPKETIPKQELLPPKEQMPDSLATNMPSVSTDTTMQKLRFYVFDDEEYIQNRLKKKIEKKKVKLRKEENASYPYNYNLLKIERAGNYQNSFLLKNASLGIEIDPIFDLSLHLRITAEDALQSLRWIAGFRPFYKPFIEFKGWDSYFKLQKFNAPVHLESSILIGQRNIETPHPFQYSHLQIESSIKYVLNQYHALIIIPRLLFLRRRDKDLLGILAKGKENLSQTNTLPSLSISYRWDKSLLYGPNFPKYGHKGEIVFSSYYSFKTHSILFNEIFCDIRKYVPVLKNYVLAFRIQAGVNWGTSKQLYSIGGLENWAFFSLDNSIDLPFMAPVENLYFTRFITPMRGFNYNTRNGSQFGILNTEFRIPILKWFPQYLQTQPLYNLWGVIFYDIGIAWKTGNPLSQKNPIDAQTIVSPPFTITVQSLKSPFIMGLGAGLRMQFFGHTLRLDFSWPIEDNVFTRISPLFTISLARDF